MATTVGPTPDRQPRISHHRLSSLIDIPMPHHHHIPPVLVRKAAQRPLVLLLPTAAALFAVKELSGLMTMLVEAHRDNMGRILGEPTTCCSTLVRRFSLLPKTW